MLSAAPSFSCVASRVIFTGQAPARASLPSASESLWISPFGEVAYTEQPIRVGQGAGRRDLRAARPPAEAGRRERPQDLAAAGVDRHRPAVGGRDHDHVVSGAVDRHAVQIDRRGVDGPRQRHREAAQMRDVRARDAGRVFADVAALRIEPELGPVEQLCRGRARRGRNRGGARGRGGNVRGSGASAGADQHAGCRAETQPREVGGTHASGSGVHYGELQRDQLSCTGVLSRNVHERREALYPIALRCRIMCLCPLTE